MSFKFELNQLVRIKTIGQEAQVIGRAEYSHQERSYEVTYTSELGWSRGGWFFESQLESASENMSNETAAAGNVVISQIANPLPVIQPIVPGEAVYVAQENQAPSDSNAVQPESEQAADTVAEPIEKIENVVSEVPQVINAVENVVSEVVKDVASPVLAVTATVQTIEDEAAVVINTVQNVVGSVENLLR